MNIYSKISPTEILHIIQRKKDIEQGRKDLVESDQFIQVATINAPHGTTYQPHRHVFQSRSEENYIPQESWVVISGMVEVILYDLDNKILHTDILEPGDCSITLNGGHNYRMLQDSIVYEFKTGKYLGQQKDKVML